MAVFKRSCALLNSILGSFDAFNIQNNLGDRLEVRESPAERTWHLLPVSGGAGGDAAELPSLPAAPSAARYCCCSWCCESGRRQALPTIRLFHYTRVASYHSLRSSPPREPSCLIWSISDRAVFNRAPLERLICGVLGKSAVLMKHEVLK